MLHAILNRGNGVFLVAAAVAAAAFGGIDRGFLKDLLEIPSQTGSRAEILRAVAALKAAGEPHSVREWGSFSSLDAYADFFTKYLGSPERAVP
jgi:hypothetical protein